MPLSDQWTLSQYLSACRTELMDPSARWWSDAEIDGHINDWANTIQEDMALTRGTAVATTGSSTQTLTALATDVLRLDSVWWNNQQLPPRNEQDLNILYKEWRAASTSTAPQVVFMPDTQRLVLWPPLTGTGTLEIEYVKKISVATGTDIVDLPSWVRWTCRPYVTYKCYLRHGPAGDVGKAARYKAKFVRTFRRVKEIWGNYMPTRAPRAKPAMTQFEKDIMNPPVSFTVGTATVAGGTMSFADYIPTGTVNGTNVTFTLPVIPTEMQLFLNGQLQTDTVDYTLSGNTITYAVASVPQTGDYHVAWVYRT